jgi:hypothetical protein
MICFREGRDHRVASRIVLWDGAVNDAVVGGRMEACVWTDKGKLQEFCGGGVCVDRQGEAAGSGGGGMRCGQTRGSCRGVVEEACGVDRQGEAAGMWWWRHAVWTDKRKLQGRGGGGMRCGPTRGSCRDVVVEACGVDRQGEAARKLWVRQVLGGVGSPITRRSLRSRRLSPPKPSPRTAPRAPRLPQSCGRSGLCPPAGPSCTPCLAPRLTAYSTVQPARWQWTTTRYVVGKLPEHSSPALALHHATLHQWHQSTTKRAGVRQGAPGTEHKTWNDM